MSMTPHPPGAVLEIPTGGYAARMLGGPSPRLQPPWIRGGGGETVVTSTLRSHDGSAFTAGTRHNPMPSTSFTVHLGVGPRPIATQGSPVALSPAEDGVLSTGLLLTGAAQAGALSPDVWCTVMVIPPHG